MYNHEYDGSSPDPPKRDYFVPHFGEDDDIKFTKSNIANAEAVHGAWNTVNPTGTGGWTLVQTDSQVQEGSDPICSSAGCTQYKHKKKERGYKIDYPVPNFGRDKDINDNFEDLKIAEGMIGHEFQIGTAASKAKWKNPAKDVDYNFAPQLDGDTIATLKNLKDSESNLGHKWTIALQLDSDVNINTHSHSDPICSSSGCTQYKHKKKERGYKIDYPVPNFGVDTDILDSHASLATSEGALSHKLQLGTKASKAKWASPAKDVDYNFAPRLDGDIRTTQKNLGDAESTLGHKWALALQTGTDLRTSSDPICSSAGCPQSQWSEEEADKIVQYPNPYPLDYDVRTTLDHEGLASDQLGHVWHPKYFDM